MADKKAIPYASDHGPARRWPQDGPGGGVVFSGSLALLSEFMGYCLCRSMAGFAVVPVLMLFAGLLCTGGFARILVLVSGSRMPRAKMYLALLLFLVAAVGEVGLFYCLPRDPLNFGSGVGLH